MVLPGHLAGGYLATTALFSIVQLPVSENELNALYIIGTLAGEIPDIDLFAFYFKNKLKKLNDSKQVLPNQLSNNSSSEETHRNYFTHIPIFWLILSSTIFSLGIIFNSDFIVGLGLVLLAGTISHFILDSIDYGIAWLRPFSSKRFCLFKMEITENKSTDIITGSILYYWNYLKSQYIKQPTFYFEVLITATALYFLLK